MSRDIISIKSTLTQSGIESLATIIYKEDDMGKTETRWESSDDVLDRMSGGGRFIAEREYNDGTVMRGEGRTEDEAREDMHEQKK